MRFNQIGSSHGEVTESDDMEHKNQSKYIKHRPDAEREGAMSERGKIQKALDTLSKAAGYADRKRAKKESKNKQHQRKTDNRDPQGIKPPPEAQKEKPEVEQKVEDSIKTEEKPDGPEVSPQVLITLFIRCERPTLWYDGEEGGILTSDDDAPPGYAFAEPGTEVVATSWGSGFAKFDPSCKHAHKTRGVACCGYSKLSGLINNYGKSFSGAEYLVFHPLVKLLQQHMPGFKITSAAVSTLGAIAIRHFGHLPDEFRTPTILQFIHARALSDFEIARGNPVYASIAPTPEVLEMKTATVISSYGFSENHDIKKILDVDCPVIRDWHCRTDFKLFINGVVLDVSPMGVVNLFPPRMAKLVDTYQTMLCRFVGSNQDVFVRYKNTSLSFSLATKRMIGARGTPLSDNTFAGFQAGAFSKYYKARISSLGYISSAGTIDYFNRMLEAMRVFGLYTDHHTIVTSQHEHPPFTIGYPSEGEDFISSVVCEVGCSPLVMEHLIRYYLRLHWQCNPAWLRKILDSLYTTGHYAYHSLVDSFSNCAPCFEARRQAADIVHTKKALRTAYVEGHLLHLDDDIMVRNTEMKLKKENAKVGKVPRLFVNYGAGSMYANEIPDFIKVCINGGYTVEVNGVVVSVHNYSKPTPDGIQLVFESAVSAINSRNFLVAHVFSDDVILAGDLDGYKFAYNIDISSCDSSNRWPIFAILADFMRNFNEERSIGLVKQCCLPMVGQNPDEKSDKIKILFYSAFEGSGTTLTSLLNFVAASGGILATMVGMAINRANIAKDMDRHAALVAQCNMGFASVGHIVTIEQCSVDGIPVIPKMQFLKRSFMCSTKGEYVECLNYGPILRGFGLVDGDLTAESLNLTSQEFRLKSWADRFEYYGRGVVAGLVHEPSTPILEALRLRFPTFGDVKTIKCSNALLSHDSADRARHEIAMDSFHERYNTTDDEVRELCENISSLQFGDIITCKAVAKFYFVDYGLPFG